MKTIPVAFTEATDAEPVQILNGEIITGDILPEPEKVAAYFNSQDFIQWEARANLAHN